MGKRGIGSGAGMLLVGLLGGCGLLYDYKDYGLTDSAGSGGSTAHGSSGAGGGTSTCGDITSDPFNCGKCGWDCLGAACVKGECGAVAVIKGSPGADNYDHVVVD